MCVCIWHDKAVEHLRLRMCARVDICVYTYICVLIRICVCVWRGTGVAWLRLHCSYSRVTWICLSNEAVRHGSVNMWWRGSSMFAPTYVCLYACVWVYIHMWAYVNTSVYMSSWHRTTLVPSYVCSHDYVCVNVTTYTVPTYVCSHLHLNMCVHMIMYVYIILTYIVHTTCAYTCVFTLRLKMCVHMIMCVYMFSHILSIHLVPTHVCSLDYVCANLVVKPLTHGSWSGKKKK